MKQFMVQHFRHIGICIVAFVFMLMVSACTGVSGTGLGTTNSSTVTITGSVKSVDTTNNTVTLNIQGQTQTVTVKGLTSTQVTALQSQVGRVYTITATLNSDGSYNI